MTDNYDIVSEALNYVEAGEPVRYSRGIAALDALVAERDEAGKNAWTLAERDEWFAACKRSAEAKYRARAEAAEKALSRYRDENLELENRLEAAGAEVARLNRLHWWWPS